MKKRFQKNPDGSMVITSKADANLDAELPDGVQFRIRKSGYTFKIEAVEGDADSALLVSRFDGAPHWSVILEMGRKRALDVLQRERIFDWKKWSNSESALSKLGPIVAAAIDLLESADHLEKMHEIGLHDDALTAAMWFGSLSEELAAQVSWARRNPPPSANETRRAKVSARQQALACYIQQQGERPEKRPGTWYKGFREAYPQHKEGDKTLKADYPHALAIVRKQTGRGTSKRS